MFKVRTKWIAGAASLLIATPAFGGVNNETHGGWYPTIGSAVTAALPGDELAVEPGTYNELVVIGKTITLRSENPNDPSTVAATIIDATGLHNSAVMIGGSYARPTIWGLTITGGDTTWGGGGIYVDDDADPTVLKCVFSQNHADNRGGGMYIVSSSATVTDCTFSGNFSGADGGGMHIQNPHSIVTVTGCTFVSNGANGRGGGMYNYGGYPEVTRCSFMGNVSADGAGMYNEQSSETQVLNCIFSGNIASDDGGGMHNDESSPTVINCTFCGNHAGSAGGAMWSTVNGTAFVYNTIMWHDTPDEIDGSPGYLTTVSYSNVQGGYWGTRNQISYPRFIDENGVDNVVGTVDDNLRLLGRAPCIDAGKNDAPGLVGVTVDFDGNPRFVDDDESPDNGPDEQLPPTVDIGACEFQSLPPCPADLDGSGDIGFADILAVIIDWGPCP